MPGLPRDQKTSRQDLSNAGDAIAARTAPIAPWLLEANEFSSRQSSQSCFLKFSRGLSRLQLSAVHTVAKHLGYDFVSAKEMHLKTMRLFLRARFCVDAANVCLRVGIRTSSHDRN